MRFAYVNNLHFLWLLLVLVLFYIYSAGKNRRLMRLWGDVPLIAGLAENISGKKRMLKKCLVTASAGFIVIACAQPEAGYHWENLKRMGVDIMVVLDTSKSMLADDIKPNRLTAAKFELEDLADVLNGDRIGLTVFAGTSFVECPLTLDYGAFKLFLDHIDTELIPVPGTNIGGALRNALSAFGKGTKKHRAVILITDGEDHSGAMDAAAQEAKKCAVPVYVAGIGSREGTPIPIMDENGNKTYLKDSNGNIVLSKLGDIGLKKLALTTGGAYVNAGAGGGIGIEKIYKEKISKLEKKELKSRRRKIYENRFQLPLAIALVLMVIEGLLSEKKK